MVNHSEENWLISTMGGIYLKMKIEITVSKDAKNGFG